MWDWRTMLSCSQNSRPIDGRKIEQASQQQGSSLVRTSVVFIPWEKGWRNPQVSWLNPPIFWEPCSLLELDYLRSGASRNISHDKILSLFVSILLSSLLSSLILFYNINILGRSLQRLRHHILLRILDRYYPSTSIPQHLHLRQAPSSNCNTASTLHSWSVLIIQTCISKHFLSWHWALELSHSHLSVQSPRHSKSVTPLAGLPHSNQAMKHVQILKLKLVETAIDLSWRGTSAWPGITMTERQWSDSTGARALTLSTCWRSSPQLIAVAMLSGTRHRTSRNVGTAFRLITDVKRVSQIVFIVMCGALRLMMFSYHHDSWLLNLNRIYSMNVIDRVSFQTTGRDGRASTYWNGRKHLSCVQVSLDVVISSNSSQLQDLLSDEH